MLVGQGALHASAEVAEVADLLGAGVAKALLGKAVLPDELPYVTGSIGLLGTKPSWTLMQECDTLLMVGSSFPYSEFLPEEGDARGVQIDIDGKMIGIRYPMEVNLIGDSAETLRALITRLQRKEDRSWREKIEGEVSEWWDLMEHRAAAHGGPDQSAARLPRALQAVAGRRDHQLGFGVLRELVRTRRQAPQGDDGVAVGHAGDDGTGRPVRDRRQVRVSARPVFALVGDGAMQMNGINELITIAKYRDQWRDQRLIVLVLNNRDLNQVTWEQRAMEGDAKFEGSQDLPDFPYARYAELLGLRGIRVDTPEQVGPAWDEALSSDRPVVLEAVTDPSVPPLPPHITIEQAKALSSALLAGDPDAKDIVKQSFKQKVEEFLPGR